MDDRMMKNDRLHHERRKKKIVINCEDFAIYHNRNFLAFVVFFDGCSDMMLRLCTG